MKTRILFLFVALCAALLVTGCQTRGEEDKQAIVQTALDAILPPSFTGYVLGSHKNQYFTISLEGDGLKHTPEGWKWQWLEYDRQSNFPLLPGLNWSSTGKVKLGKRP